MTNKNPFATSPEIPSLAHKGRDLCTSLVQGDLDKCIEILIKHASEAGYEFDQETKALLNSEMAFKAKG